MLLEALVDLARLLVGMDVQRQALPLGIGAYLLEPVRGQARTEWGAQPTRAPLSRSFSSWRKYSNSRRLANRSMPRA